MVVSVCVRVSGVRTQQYCIPGTTQHSAQKILQAIGCLPHRLVCVLVPALILALLGALGLVLLGGLMLLGAVGRAVAALVAGVAGGAHCGGGRVIVQMVSAAYCCCALLSAQCMAC